MTRRILFVLFIIAALLVFAIPALAGGWAVVTLEELPTQVVAGEPVTLEFAVRQHGRALTPGYEPVIQAQNQATGESVRTTASPAERMGFYRVTLTFPSSGEWTWGISPWGGTAHDMPAISVQAPGTARSVTVVGGTPQVPASWAVAILGALIAVGGGAFYLASRYRWALGLVLVGLALGGTGVAVAANAPAPETVPLTSPPTPSPARGADLFLAKGCIVCHTHEAVADRYSGPQTNVGPELTDLALPADYLHTWLRDPAAVKPNTEMPNLELGEAEIESLVAFLMESDTNSTPIAKSASLPNYAESCPLTYPGPNGSGFTPPSPFPEQPSAGNYWYGTETLWTQLPLDPIWRDLPHDEDGYSQKLFWWSRDYDPQAEPQPDLEIRGNRFDAEAPPLQVSNPTNGSHPTLGSFMVVGVTFPTIGCWDIRGQYGNTSLIYTVWVAP